MGQKDAYKKIPPYGGIFLLTGDMDYRFKRNLPQKLSLVPGPGGSWWQKHSTKPSSSYCRCSKLTLA